MTISIRTLAIAMTCVSMGAHAVPNDVARIFDKNQRRLEAPPSNLRSNETDATTRYFSGLERVERSMAADGEEPASTTESLEVADPASVTPVSPTPESRIVIQDSRGSRRQDRLGSYGFDGRRVFGVGFVGVGSYGIFGAEFDFGFGNEWSGGFGIGTGMAYSTWGVHARKYFQSGNLTPYFQMGYANWTLHRNPFRENEVYPIYLGEQFLQDKDGNFKVRKPVHLLYPAIGVLFQSQSGLAFTMQLQYLISALDFKGALTGGFGLHLYF